MQGTKFSINKTGIYVTCRQGRALGVKLSVKVMQTYKTRVMTLASCHTSHTSSLFHSSYCCNSKLVFGNIPTQPSQY